MGNEITRVLDCRKEFERLLVKVEELEAICERSTPVMTGVPRSGAMLKDETWARLIDYKTACADKLNEYILMKIELDEEIGWIGNPDIRTALRYKYIDGLTIAEIAGRMSYSTRTIDRFLKIGRRIYKSLVE